MYKYLAPARTDVLERALSRFSPPHAFNDPFDLKPNILGFDSADRWNREFADALPKVVEEQYAQLPEQVRNTLSLSTVHARATELLPKLAVESFQWAQLLNPLLRSTVESKFERLIGILSLTENADSLLMWAHYASSHEGFVIEVDPTSSFFNRRRSPSDEFFHLRRVLYDAKRPTLSFSDDASFEPFLTKGLDWEYEHEWRMLAPLSAAETVISDGSSEVHLFVFPKIMIKSVIVGARASEAMKSALLGIVKNDAEYRNVLVQSASVDSAEYRLNFETLNG